MNSLHGWYALQLLHRRVTVTYSLHKVPARDTARKRVSECAPRYFAVGTALYPFGKMASKLLVMSSVRNIDQAKELLDILRGSEVKFSTGVFGLARSNKKFTRIGGGKQGSRAESGTADTVGSQNGNLPAHAVRTHC